MMTITYFGTTVWLMLYNSVFVNTATRRLTLWAIIFNVLSLWVVAVTLETDQTETKVKWLLTLNAFVFNPVVEAFLLTPALMFFSKCVPHSIEGLMLGFINSIYSFNVQIVGRFTCLAFMKGQDITIDNYTNLSKSYYSAWWL
jgi:hypothetical protein